MMPTNCIHIFKSDPVVLTVTVRHIMLRFDCMASSSYLSLSVESDEKELLPAPDNINAFVPIPDSRSTVTRVRRMSDGRRTDAVRIISFRLDIPPETQTSLSVPLRQYSVGCSRRLG